MIIWLCPRPDKPSGGVMFIHRFAGLLGRNHMPSRVVQSEPFTVWWDATPVDQTITHYSGNPRLVAENITVIPEVFWHGMWRDWPNPVMFAQNWVWLDKRIPLENAKTITCSRHMANYLWRNYPGVDVRGIVHPYVAPGVFVRNDAKRMKNMVLLINRRTTAVKKLAGLLDKMDYHVVINDGTSTQKVLANYMQQAEYYVHLVSPEGWPQICVEAMQCGTLVVGTTGGSGNEFMFHKETAMVAQDSTYGWETTEDDMVYQVISHLNLLREDEALRDSIREKAFQWSGQYTEEKTTAELLKVFGEL